MNSERRSLHKTVDGKCLSVTVEWCDGWVIREIWLGDKRADRVDALRYASPEEALMAGEIIARSLLEAAA